MSPFKYLAVFALVAVAFAQDFEYSSAPRPAPPRIQAGYSGPAAPKPTPIAILKQINRHNEDGSYTYGYEGADGSFKIETKLPTGEVKGKYGYVDDTGKVRVVEYGATKHGFQPAGEGITVAPPTLVDETTNKDGTINPEYSGAYYGGDDQQQEAPRAAAPRPQPQPRPIYESYSAPQQFAPAPAPVPQRAQVSGAAPVSNFEFDIPSRPAPSRANYAPVRSFVPARPAPQYSQEQEEYEPVQPQPKITYAEPVPRSQPNYAPAPISRPAPQYAPRPQAAPQYAPRPVQAPQGRGGILDQLSKDYALPQGGAAPLHDISFGYY